MGRAMAMSGLTLRDELFNLLSRFFYPSAPINPSLQPTTDLMQAKRLFYFYLDKTGVAAITNRIGPAPRKIWKILSGVSKCLISGGGTIEIQIDLVNKATDVSMDPMFYLAAQAASKYIVFGHDSPSGGGNASYWIGQQVILTHDTKLKYVLTPAAGANIELTLMFLIEETINLEEPT